MNKLFTKVLIAVLLLVISAGTLSASCSVQGKNAAGENVTIVISCDFPVLTDTGDAAADQSNYEAAMAAWAVSSPVDHAAVSELVLITNYNITSGSLLGMSAERQAAIQAKPDYYIVVPE